MNEFDKRVETVIDALLHKANEYDIELTVESTFDDHDDASSLSALVHNPELNKFAIMAVNVQEYPDDVITFMTFNNKLYEYCRMEGFEKDQMLKGFDNKVFRRVDIKQFFNFILYGDESK